MNTGSGGNALSEQNPDSSHVIATTPSRYRQGGRQTAPAELEGGQGRQIYFRPQRYQPKELGAVGARVNVDVLGHDWTCTLHDVSQNGVAFEWPDATPVSPGAIIDELRVTFDGRETFRGRARIRSLRNADGRVIVGASFIDLLMDIEDVLHLRDVKAWTGGAGAQWPSLTRRPWFREGHDHFKARISELRFLLEDAREWFGDLETKLPWQVVHGEQESAARATLVERIRADFVADFVRCSEQINHEYLGVTESELEVLKEFSRRDLLAFFMESPAAHRALHKPLGYPGDYEIMKYMYGDMFAGPTLFAKAMNLAILSTRTGDAVRARKDLLKSRLAELIESRASPDGAPVRILSIAAGPAQEVYELLNEKPSLKRAVEIVLFDQDKNALAYAYGRTKRLVDSKWSEQVRVIYLHDAIKRLLRDATIFAEYGVFDGIVVSGLLDYLEVPTASRLCKHLSANLAPGGELLIGNMVPENPNRWFMELLLDWNLIHRTREELLAVGCGAVPELRVGLLEETTGLNPFLSVTNG